MQKGKIQDKQEIGNRDGILLYGDWRISAVCLKQTFSIEDFFVTSLIYDLE